ncbi:MAG: hypothetical protein ACLQT7_03680 [Candidatus Dormibacteria bacterium]
MVLRGPEHAGPHVAVPLTRRPPARAGAALRARLLIGAPLAVIALTSLTALPAQAAGGWWQLVAFAGQSVSRVAVVQGRVTAVVGGQTTVQTASGFVAASGPPPTPAAKVTAGSRTWSISPAGLVLVSRGSGSPSRDPGSPDLGPGAHLIAAPVATPGVVIAVSTSGTIWRRAPTGGWSVSLALLPTTLVTGTPAVTSLVAFNTRAVSGVVYLGTDGYGTLLTSNGGDDWVRADPGLPDDVLSLAADPSGPAPAIWAGTSRGLYVHRLQTIPTIPSYSGGSLTGRWLITIALSIGVIVLGGLALVAWSRRRPVARGDGSPT